MQRPPKSHTVTGDRSATASAITPSSRQAWRRWGLRGLLALVVVAAIAQVPWVVRGGDGDRAAQLRRDLARTDAEARRLGSENLRMADEVEALRTDVSAIEARARDELGMVYPGELVLRVESEAP